MNICMRVRVRACDFEYIGCACVQTHTERQSARQTEESREREIETLDGPYNFICLLYSPNLSDFSLFVVFHLPVQLVFFSLLM